jgi:hypothetical protein
MKKPAVCVALAVFSATALSADSLSQVDRIVNCAVFNDAPERLACFDREVEALARARLAAPAAVASPSLAVPVPMASAPRVPGPVMTVPAVPAVAPGSTFGQEQLSAKRQPVAPDAEQVLHGRITALRSGGSVIFLVTLDNGQVWRHENSVQGAYLRVGDAITIGKGALGSYRMTRDAGDEKNWIRVARVR